MLDTLIVYLNFALDTGKHDELNIFPPFQLLVSDFMLWYVILLVLLGWINGLTFICYLYVNVESIINQMFFQEYPSSHRNWL